MFRGFIYLIIDRRSLLSCSMASICTRSLNHCLLTISCRYIADISAVLTGF